MHKVSIIGAAGTVGSSVGYQLATQSLVDEIVYVDIPSKKSLTIGQAEDTNHAAAYTSHTNVYSGNYSDTENSDIIIVTAGKPRQPGQTRVDLTSVNRTILDSIFSDISQYNDDFISIITTNPVDLLNRHVCDFENRPREHVIGFGGVLDSSRFRYTLSKKLDVPANHIKATILGEHGDSQVPIFSHVNLLNKPTPVFSPDEKSSILSDLKESAMCVIKQKGATQWGPASGVCHLVKSIVENSHSIFPCSAVLNGEYGISDVSLGVPVRLGSNGIEEIVEWDLTSEETDALTQSAIKLASEYQLLS